MNVTTGVPVMLQVAAIATPIVAAAGGFIFWQVLRLRDRSTKHEAQINGINGTCQERLVWMQKLSATVERTDRNVIRLGAKAGVALETA